MSVQLLLMCACVPRHTCGGQRTTLLLHMAPGTGTKVTMPLPSKPLYHSGSVIFASESISKTTPGPHQLSFFLMICTYFKKQLYLTSSQQNNTIIKRATDRAPSVKSLPCKCKDLRLIPSIYIKAGHSSKLV